MKLFSFSYNQIFSFLFAFVTLFSISSCDKGEDITGNGEVNIEIENVANDKVFALNNNYVNANGDTLNFSMFNYYLSNFSFTKTDGTVYTVPKDECYFLIKQDDVASKILNFKNIPAGDYKSVSFIIGVDSLKSTAPVSERTGVLDPAGAGSGMYWAWNSGYIFLKAEGTSPQAPLDSTSNKHPFKYHIGLYGGYSSATLNNLKKVTLSEAGGSNAIVRTNKTPEIHIAANVTKLLDSPTKVSVAANPVVMVSPFSATIANNYANMFAIEHIHN